MSWPGTAKRLARNTSRPAGCGPCAVRPPAPAVNRTAAAFDVPRFTDWLGQATGEPAEVTVMPMSGGASCEMFRIERLGRSWGVRRAPLTSVSDTAHHVVREAQVIESLAGSGVPVPTVLAIGEDPAILGAPFFVMSFVDGDVVRRNGLPDALAAQPDSHHAVGEGLIDTLVSLHDVDWRSTPLAELSHPEGFLARQVNRWMTQLESYRSRELDSVDQFAAWLAANQPTRGDLTVMHGDYKLDNVLWSRQPPPRVLSVVDFEMTTVGDPLIDLAWALIFWPEDGNLDRAGLARNSQWHRRRTMPDATWQRYAAPPARSVHIRLVSGLQRMEAGDRPEASMRSPRGESTTRTTKSSDSSSTNYSRVQRDSPDDRLAVLRRRPSRPGDRRQSRTRPSHVCGTGRTRSAGGDRQPQARCLRRAGRTNPRQRRRRVRIGLPCRQLGVPRPGRRGSHSTLGAPDGLINNAGMSPLVPSLLETSETLFDKVIGVNLKGPTRLTALAADAMKATGGVDHQHQLAGVGQTHLDGPRVLAAKAGLNALTKAAALEYANAGVRVNGSSVAPSTPTPRRASSATRTCCPRSCGPSRWGGSDVRTRSSVRPYICCRTRRPTPRDR